MSEQEHTEENFEISFKDQPTIRQRKKNDVDITSDDGVSGGDDDGVSRNVEPGSDRGELPSCDHSECSQSECSGCEDIPHLFEHNPRMVHIDDDFAMKALVFNLCAGAMWFALGYISGSNSC